MSTEHDLDKQITVESKASVGVGIGDVDAKKLEEMGKRSLKCCWK